MYSINSLAGVTYDWLISLKAFIRTKNQQFSQTLENIYRITQDLSLFLFKTHRTDETGTKTFFFKVLFLSVFDLAEQITQQFEVNSFDSLII